MWRGLCTLSRGPFVRGRGVTFLMRILPYFLVVAVVAGCSAPDPGVVDFSPSSSSSSSKKKKATEEEEEETQDQDAGTTVQPTVDAGTTPTGANAFANAPPYTAGTAPRNTTQIAAHGATGQAGNNCMGCHGQGRGPTYQMAGTVKGAPGTEVRIVAADGATEVAKAYTDAVGNFWISQANGLNPGMIVGIRNATLSQTMNTPLTTQSQFACNSCHVAGGSAQPLAL
jgi:hypothetical protein